MKPPTLADLMIERMRDGAAHDDSIAMLTSSVEQVRAKATGAEWPADLYLAQAEILVGADGMDSVEALARCAAMALDLASLSATFLIALSDGLGYDVDALLAGMAAVRPPYRP